MEKSHLSNTLVSRDNGAATRTAFLNVSSTLNGNVSCELMCRLLLIEAISAAWFV